MVHIQNMALTIEQRIVQKQAELARLKNKTRSLETGQKIVLGGLLMELMREDKKIAEWAVAQINKKVTRPADRDRVTPLLISMGYATQDPE